MLCSWGMSGAFWQEDQVDTRGDHGTPIAWSDVRAPLPPPPPLPSQRRAFVPRLVCVSGVGVADERGGGGEGAGGDAARKVR